MDYIIAVNRLYGFGEGLKKRSVSNKYSGEGIFLLIFLSIMMYMIFLRIQ